MRSQLVNLKVCGHAADQYLFQVQMMLYMFLLRFGFCVLLEGINSLKLICFTRSLMYSPLYKPHVNTNKEWHCYFSCSVSIGNTIFLKTTVF